MGASAKPLSTATPPRRPRALKQPAIQPAKAGYNTALGEFIYLYDDLRREPSPE